MVSKKKTRPKRGPNIAFPPRKPRNQKFPAGGTFFGEIFLKNTMGPLRDPIGRIPDGEQKKKAQKRVQILMFPQSPKYGENCPWREIFFREIFFDTLGPLRDPIGRIPDGEQKNSYQKKWSNSSFPLQEPLKTKKCPWREKKCREQFFQHLGGSYIPPKKLFRW